MDFKRGTNRASRIITERSTWPSVEHNRESRAFLVRAHLVFSSFSLSYFAIVLGVCWSDFLQRFESYEDRFRAVVIVRLAIFSELPFLSQFFFSPLLLEVLWGFLFCSSFALKWYECAFFLSNAHCLSHSFVLASFLLMTISDCLILVVTFIGCRFASKKCAFTGETLCVFVVVCLTPSASFC
jgi:hypothetical protein